jgi:hypothetical protein
LDPANPAPGGPEAAIPAADVRLDDRYTADRGRILLNGTQALLRLLLVQRRRDLAAGLNTAGFVSGYRGSPLGGLDQALWQSKALLDAAPVHFQPGVNEDLAATAVWGTQQAASLPATRVDGIYALWYGKGPGVDRSGDPVRHANRQGTSRHGGVLMAFGDDHGAKSSTVTQQSEPLLAGLGVPVLYPATVTRPCCPLASATAASPSTRSARRHGWSRRGCRRCSPTPAPTGSIASSSVDPAPASAWSRPARRRSTYARRSRCSASTRPMPKPSDSPSTGRG